MPSGFAYAAARTWRTVQCSFRGSMGERGTDIKASPERRAKHRDAYTALNGRHTARWPKQRAKIKNRIHRSPLGHARVDPWPIPRNRAGATEYGQVGAKRPADPHTRNWPGVAELTPGVPQALSPRAFA